MFLITWFKNLHYRIKERIDELKGEETFSILFLFLIVVVGSSIGIYLLENKINSAFKSIGDALWFTIVTLSTVGYGDKTPVSAQGKLFGVIMMFFGVAITGTVSGKIASYLVERQLKKGQGLISLKKLTGHFVICGWKKEMPLIISDILKLNPELKPEQIVLVCSVSPQLIQDLKAHRRLARINFIYGDYTDEDVLKRANIQKAKVALIVADQSNPNASMHEIDSKTVMTAMTIETINKEIYTCAELLDSKFEKYLKLAHCDEIILSREYSRILLANVFSSSGVSHIIYKLISADSPTPLKVVDIPEQFLYKTFSELQQYFKAKDGSLVIGIIENTGNVYQRKKEALKEAQKTPDISKLVYNLRAVKKIKPNEPVLNPPDNYVIKHYTKAILIPLNTRIGKKDEKKS